MMDTIHFKGTPSAFAEYVINLAVQELAREHRQEQKAQRRVTFAPFVLIKEIEEDEDEPVYMVIKRDKRRGEGCWLPLWKLVKRIFDQLTGTVQVSSEMKPQWVETTNIPFDEMWPDDTYWFSMVLEGQKFAGYFLFEGHDKILKYTLDKVDTV